MPKSTGGSQLRNKLLRILTQGVCCSENEIFVDLATEENLTSEKLAAKMEGVKVAYSDREVTSIDRISTVAP